MIHLSSLLVGILSVGLTGVPKNADEATLTLTLTNDAIPVVITTRAVVSYQRWGFDETAESAPVDLRIDEPIVVKSVDLNLAAPWFLLSPLPLPMTIGGGQSVIMTIPIFRVSIH